MSAISPTTATLTSIMDNRDGNTLYQSIQNITGQELYTVKAFVSPFVLDPVKR